MWLVSVQIPPMHWSFYYSKQATNAQRKRAVHPLFFLPFYWAGLGVGVAVAPLDLIYSAIV